MISAMKLYVYLKISRFLIDFDVENHRRHHRAMLRRLGYCTWCEIARECHDLVCEDWKEMPPVEEKWKWHN